MIVKLTVHDGGLKRFSVPLQSLTGQGNAECVVFARNSIEAGRAAIGKMQDKWLRHQNISTRWRLVGKPVEC